MLTYYISDRRQFAGSEAQRRNQLLRTIGRCAAAGVDYIQLREKDLSIRALERLTGEALRAVRDEGPARLLINHRTDVALACGADGVHLTGDDMAASDARALATGALARMDAARQAGSQGSGQAQSGGQFLVGVSCHSVEEVRLAESHGANFVVLSPIFEKARMESAGAENVIRNGIGIEELRRAARKDRAADPQIEAGEARAAFTVFALGGVDLDRAALCASAGAAGVAGIRIFQQAEDVAALVRSLRAL